MFRRKSAPAETAVTIEPTPGGKGRPTPSRKEAEAAAKARAKASSAGDRRAAASGDRAARAASMARTREAMKTGDDRYLPTKDKGPVKRFVRDFVDTKLTFSEWALPLVILTLAGGFVASQNAARLISNFTTVYIVIVAINLVVLRVQLGRQLTRRFPDRGTKGLTFYMLSRALQLRWIRQPRPQRSIGEALPDTYR